MPRVLKPCGTHAAYQRHLRLGEKPCAECTRAKRNYQRDWNKANRKELPPLKPCGTEAAYRRHLRRGESPCAACRAAESAASTKRRADRAAESRAA